MQKASVAFALILIFGCASAFDWTAKTFTTAPKNVVTNNDTNGGAFINAGNIALLDGNGLVTLIGYNSTTNSTSNSSSRNVTTQLGSSNTSDAYVTLKGLDQKRANIVGGYVYATDGATVTLNNQPANGGAVVSVEIVKTGGNYNVLQVFVHVTKAFVVFTNGNGTIFIGQTEFGKSTTQIIALTSAAAPNTAVSCVGLSGLNSAYCLYTTTENRTVSNNTNATNTTNGTTPNKTDNATNKTTDNSTNATNATNKTTDNSTNATNATNKTTDNATNATNKTTDNATNATNSTVDNSTNKTTDNATNKTADNATNKTTPALEASTPILKDNASNVTNITVTYLAAVTVNFDKSTVGKQAQVFSGSDFNVTPAGFGAYNAGKQYGSIVIFNNGTKLIVDNNAAITNATVSLTNSLIGAFPYLNTIALIYTNTTNNVATTSVAYYGDKAPASGDLFVGASSYSLLQTSKGDLYYAAKNGTTSIAIGQVWGDTGMSSTVLQTAFAAVFAMIAAIFLF